MSEGVATQDTERPSESAGETLQAALWPSLWGEAATDADVQITCYIVTGRHGGLRIPESFCRECNLFVRAADRAAASVEADVSVRVVSWWTHFLPALRYGGYHPPIMVVGGKRLCQGHHVPTVEEVTDAIEAALDR